ncbi:hypothetical protein HHI36_024237 [Cryptolaemus montrouzieri]|uniref:Uncharacterized protein n=1 Tax=Cryptolaemus montrouzieri TaxID=559131 RepID=A0ABD2NIR9_9CUCU
MYQQYQLNQLKYETKLKEYKISGLKDGDGNLLTSPKDIANHISETLEKQFSDENLDVEFRKYKNRVESTPLVIDYDSNYPINQPFSLKELMASIHQFRNSAAGPKKWQESIILPFYETGKPKTDL